MRSYFGKTKNENVPPAKIRPALEIMKAECHKRRSNDEFAKACKIGKNHFIKLFKELAGVSPQQYYQNLIIDKSTYS